MACFTLLKGRQMFIKKPITVLVRGLLSVSNQCQRNNKLQLNDAEGFPVFDHFISGEMCKPF